MEQDTESTDVTTVQPEVTENPPKKTTRKERASANGRCTSCFKKPWDCRCKDKVIA